MPPIQPILGLSLFDNEILLLLFTILSGSALGRVTVRGFSLGTSCVLFVALVVGHYGYELPQYAGQFGLILFVYCLGISAGPQFFRMLNQHAKTLAVVGVAMILAAAAATYGFARFSGLPADLAGGLFAGALTSTPALAAATEALPPDSQVAVGFGIAYPFGAIGVVIFVQLAARMFGGADEAESEAGQKAAKIARVTVEVLNPSIYGLKASDLSILERFRCQISRARVGDNLVPISGEYVLQEGQELLLVGHEDDVQYVADYIGRTTEQRDYVLDTERQRRRVVVTGKDVIGKTLKELHLRGRFGVTITRVTRQNVEFVPTANDAIHFGDALTAIGEPDGLAEFEKEAGHRERSLDETDLISLSAGLLLGILAGMVRVEFAGMSLSLGLAGGPLVVGLLLGHFGNVGPIRAHFPLAARLLLTEVGLAMFLANAGVTAGEQLVPVVKQYGVSICLGAVLITVLPMIVGVLVTRFVFQVGLYRSLGAICGAMTSTPGLGALMTQVESDVPVTAYATVYPIALILMSFLTPVLIQMIGALNGAG